MLTRSLSARLARLPSPAAMTASSYSGISRAERKFKSCAGTEALFTPSPSAPDGRTVLSGSQDDTLILWDLKSGEAIQALRGHGGAITSIAISPDGRHALSGSVNMPLRLWDLR